jgi:hypothetical protein
MRIVKSIKPKAKPELSTLERNLILISKRDIKEIYDYTIKVSKELIANSDTDENTP